MAALFCISQYIPESSKVVIPELKKALLDKDVSVVFTALSVWKQIISASRHDNFGLFHNI